MEYHLIQCQTCLTVAEMRNTALGTYEPVYAPPKDWHGFTGYCSRQCYGEALIKEGQKLKDGRDAGQPARGEPASILAYFRHLLTGQHGKGAANGREN